MGVQYPVIPIKKVINNSSGIMDQAIVAPIAHLCRCIHIPVDCPLI